MSRGREKVRNTTKEGNWFSKISTRQSERVKKKAGAIKGGRADSLPSKKAEVP